MRPLFFVAILVLGGVAGAAHALPELELRAGERGEWSHDAETDIWVVSDADFELVATAHARRIGYDKRGLARDRSSGVNNRVAYLIATASPRQEFDGFDISIRDSEGDALHLVHAGLGPPPIGFSRSGIWGSYFEIYEFEFDDALQAIDNTRHDGAGQGWGYLEAFQIRINEFSAGTSGVYFDLVTRSGDRFRSILGGIKRVKRFAPLSHEVLAINQPVPEPHAVVLFLLGGAIVGHATRRTATR